MLTPERNPVPAPPQASATRHAAEVELLECLSRRAHELPPLYDAICAITDVLRTEKLAPEEMLVALKALLRRVPHAWREDPVAREERDAKLIQWSIEHYFRDVDAARYA
jgi:hypothetical protein